MDSEVRIDGSQGEGGGQMLRTSLALSAAYGKPFEMLNIRAKREKPGLKRQHLTCVRAVAQICGAQVEGDEADSMRLSFKPGKIKGGTYQFDIGTYGKSRKSVANEVAHQIRDFVKSGKACEKHLADQLLVPLHLFFGQQKEWDEYYDGWVTNWSLAIQKETSHYTTNEQVISAFNLLRIF